jgi:hypothetical protein
VHDAARPWRIRLYASQGTSNERVTVEGQLSRHHLEQNHAERVDVALLGARLAFDLLGRHVVEGPEDLLAVRRERLRRHYQRGSRQTEIGNYNTKLFVIRIFDEHHVVALEIAMNDAGSVSVRHACDHLQRNRARIL